MKTIASKILLFFALALLLQLSGFVSYSRAFETSVVVVPFYDLGGKNDLSWLGEALSDGVGRKLSAIPSLAVLARPAVKNTGFSVQEVIAVGKQLSAQWVIYGDYNLIPAADKSKIDTYQIKSYLIKTADSNPTPQLILAVESPLKELFTWQIQIAEQVLEQLQIKPNPAEKEALAKAPTASLLAYENYYKSLIPYLANENQQALRFCQQAIIADRKYEDPILRTVILYERMEKPEDMAAAYLLLESIWTEQKNTESLLVLYEKLGNLYLQMEQYVKAMKSFQKLIELADIKKDDVLLANAYSLLARTYCVKLEYQNAIKTYDQALKIQQKVGNQEVIAETHNKIGQIYLLKTLDVTAIKYFDKALEVYKQIGHEKGLAQTYNNIGLVHYENKRRQQALNFFHKALELAKKTDDKALLAQTYTNIGKLHTQEIHYDQAITAFQKALKLEEEQKNTLAQSELYRSLAKIYNDREDGKTALDYLQKAADIKAKLKLKADMADIYEQMALIHYDYKEFDPALVKFKKALEIQLTIGEQTKLAFLYKNIGAIYVFKESYQEALQSLLTELKMEHSLKDLPAQAGTYYRIANIYQKLGQYEKAINYLEKTIDIDSKTNDPNLYNDKRYLDELLQQYKTQAKTDQNPPVTEAGAKSAPTDSAPVTAVENPAVPTTLLPPP